VSVAAWARDAFCVDDGAAVDGLGPIGHVPQAVSAVTPFSRRAPDADQLQLGGRC